MEEGRYVRADLHNHLRTSSRYFKGDFDEAVDTANERLGGGIIGVVNFEDDRYGKFIGGKGYERTYLGDEQNGVYVPERDITIVKGQEVPTKEGHLVVFGTGRDVHLKKGRTVEDTIKEAQDNNGIIVADHLFYLSGLGEHFRKKPYLLDHIDAIEIFNGEAEFGLPFGPFPLGANKKAQDFYERIKPNFVGAISTSDGHSLYELGRNWTEIERPSLVQGQEFVNSLRESVRNTNLSTPRRESRLVSVVGAMDHIADLIHITKIAPKLGMDGKYKTERPE